MPIKFITVTAYVPNPNTSKELPSACETIIGQTIQIADGQTQDVSNYGIEGLERIALGKESVLFFGDKDIIRGYQSRQLTLAETKKGFINYWPARKENGWIRDKIHAAMDRGDAILQQMGVVSDPAADSILLNLARGDLIIITPGDKRLRIKHSL